MLTSESTKVAEMASKNAEKIVLIDCYVGLLERDWFDHYDINLSLNCAER